MPSDQETIDALSTAAGDVLRRLADLEKKMSALEDEGGTQGASPTISPRSSFHEAAAATKTSGWVELDSRPAVIAITASKGTVYQLRKERGISTVWRLRCWQDTEEPVTRWQLIDASPETAQIVAASAGLAGEKIYQRHHNGSIWVYAGDRMNWQSLNESTIFRGIDAVDISASSHFLYKRSMSGYLSEVVSGEGGWRHSPLVSLKSTATAVQLVVSGNGTVHVRTYDGGVYTYRDSVFEATNWVHRGSHPNAVGLVACNDELYLLLQDGTITALANGGSFDDWAVVSTSLTAEIAGDDRNGLYRRDDDGGIWAYSGAPSDWLQVGCEEGAMGLEVTSDAVYVLRNDGTIKALRC